MGTATNEHIVAGYKLYPNPAKGQLTIEYDNEKSTKNVYIRVYNVTGQMVLNVSLPSEQYLLNINTSELTAGIYSYIIGTEATILKRGNIAIQR